MAESADLWNQVRHTRALANDEESIAVPAMFGILRRTNTRWSVTGENKEGRHYSLSAIDHEPRGIITAVLWGGPLLTAWLVERATIDEGSPVTWTYDAKITPKELDVTGTVSRPRHGETDFPLTRVLTRTEAEGGFETAVAGLINALT